VTSRGDHPTRSTSTLTAATVATAHAAAGLRPWPLARWYVPPALPCHGVSPGLFYYDHARQPEARNSTID